MIIEVNSDNSIRPISIYNLENVGFLFSCAPGLSVYLLGFEIEVSDLPHQVGLGGHQNAVVFVQTAA